MFILILLSLPLCHSLQLVLEHSTPLLRLAAQNLRRYIHQLDSTYLPPLILSPSHCDPALPSLLLALASPSAPCSTPYTSTHLNSSSVRLTSCDLTGLHAYHATLDLLHALGVYFSAAGVPFLPPASYAHALARQQQQQQQQQPSLPLSTSTHILATAAALQPAAPAFQYRGLQPWGSYPIGNDWWDVDEYRRVLELTLQLKGNWIGMHSYPCSYAYPEPGVWLGAAGNQTPALLPSGNLTPAAAALPHCTASWASSQRPAWGLRATPTSALKFGAAALYEVDCYGNRALTSGPGGVCPLPTDPQSNAAAYNRIGGWLYQSVFAFAAQLGMSTALGSEFPLPSSLQPAPPPPPPPPSPAPAPLNTFWSAGRQDTFVTATACAECPPAGSADAYQQRATPGGGNGSAVALLLPLPGPGLLPLDCYWWDAGADAWLGVAPPPSAHYVHVRTEGYVLAAPGSSSSSSSAPLYQYARSNCSKPGGTDTWLVLGEAGRAAAAALGYAPSGSGEAVGWAPFGPAPSPPPPPPPPTPPSALTQAIYTDAFTRLQRLYGKNLTWYWAWTEENVQWQHISQHSPLMQAAVAELPAMAAAAAAAGAQFSLALGGWMMGAADNRSLLDAHAPPSWPISALDGHLGADPPDSALNTTARAQRWSYAWAEDDMALTALQQWVGRNLAHAQRALALGATGHASLTWRTTTVAPALTALLRFPYNTSLTAADFLAAYAGAAYGGGAAGAALGGLLTALDSAAMPRPVHYDPGCMAPSTALCSPAAAALYAAPVAAWAAQAAAVAASGDPAALARYNYTAAHLAQLQAMQTFQCAWGLYAGALAAIQALPPHSPQQAAAAAALGFPAFAAMVGNASALAWAAMDAVGSYGDLGVLLQLHGDLEEAAGEGALAQLQALAAGAPCGQACSLPEDYSGSGRPASVRVLTVRTVLQRGEALNLRAHVLGGRGCSAPAGACAAHVALLGSSSGGYVVSPLPGEGGAGRAVYAASVPLPAGAEEGGVQWYVNCSCSGEGGALLFPPTAPALPQTVVFI